MKNVLVILLASLFLGTVAMMAAAGESKQAETPPLSVGGEESQAGDRVYPIAPGIWYPGEGPIPEKPVRYYRVRCWPGCHSGSSHGMYPDSELDYDPIFPTSTMDQCPTAHGSN